MAAERILPPAQLRVLLAAVDVFDRSGASYAAVGAFARNQYAEPRATKDLANTPAVFRARWARGFVRLAHRDHPFPIDLFRSGDPFDAAC